MFMRRTFYASTLALVFAAIVATIPRFAVELVLGREQTDEMAFASQRVYPRALEAAGFRWRHPTIAEALAFELRRHAA